MADKRPRPGAARATLHSDKRQIVQPNPFLNPVVPTYGYNPADLRANTGEADYVITSRRNAVPDLRRTRPAAPTPVVPVTPTVRPPRTARRMPTPFRVHEQAGHEEHKEGPDPEPEPVPGEDAMDDDEPDDEPDDDADDDADDPVVNAKFTKDIGKLLVDSGSFSEADMYDSNGKRRSLATLVKMSQASGIWSMLSPEEKAAFSAGTGQLDNNQAYLARPVPRQKRLTRAAGFVINGNGDRVRVV